MEASEKAHDDLTEIRGIGSTRQQWLRESFDIHTYQDLAALSVDEIESRLRVDGQIPSRKAIETWVIQAQELANPVIGREVSPPAKQNGWKPFASFVVEFQNRAGGPPTREYRTAVHYMEEDVGTYWSGIENGRLCQWMLDQIRDKMALEPEKPVLRPAQLPEPSPAETPRSNVKIGQVRLFQPPKSESPQIIDAGRSFQGMMKSGEPFAVEVDFELSGPAAAEITRQKIKYDVKSYAYDRVKNVRVDLSASGANTFEEGKVTYTFALPKATLGHGDYRLWILVTPQTKLALPDFVEAQSLQVV